MSYYFTSGLTWALSKNAVSKYDATYIYTFEAHIESYDRRNNMWLMSDNFFFRWNNVFRILQLLWLQKDIRNIIVRI